MSGINDMNYLQLVVYRAICKNPRLDEQYARDFALSVEHPIKLWNLDFHNIDLVAAELGCTPDEMDAFMMITKAIYNAGKCEHTIAENRAYTDAIEQISKTNDVI